MAACDIPEPGVGTIRFKVHVKQIFRVGTLEGVASEPPLEDKSASYSTQKEYVDNLQSFS